MSLNLPPQIRPSTTLMEFYRQLREANPPESATPYPPSDAIAEGATSPDPGVNGSLVWSTTAGRLLVWDGSAWWPAGAYSFGPETVSGTSYTFVAGDSYKLKRFTNAGAVAATVPTNASVPYPIGRTQIYCQAAGAGGLTLDDNGGAITFESAISLTSAAQHQLFTLSKINTNTWLVS